MSADPLDEESFSTAPPARRKVREERIGDELSLHFRRGFSFLTIFLLLFLIAWSAACAFIVSRVAQEPALENILFAVPFLVGWIFVFFALIGLLLTSSRLAIGPEGLESRSRLLLFWSTRRVPLDEITSVTAGDTNYKINDQPQKCIAVHTLGKPVLFAGGIHPDECRYWAKILRDHLASLRAELGNTVVLRAQPEETKHARDPQGNEIVRAGDREVARPSDSRLTLIEDFGQLTFRKRPVGPIEWIGGLIGVALVGGFWNGIVAVFVINMVKSRMWFGLLFMVPFLLVGLALVLALMAVFFSPLVRTRYLFSREEFRKRHRVLLFSIGKAVPAEVVARIIIRWQTDWKEKLEAKKRASDAQKRHEAIQEEFRKIDATAGRKKASQTQTVEYDDEDDDELDEEDRKYLAANKLTDEEQAAEDAARQSSTGGSSDGMQANRWELVLIGRDEQDLLAIGGLTKGEARWMGDVLARQLPEWGLTGR